RAERDPVSRFRLSGEAGVQDRRWQGRSEVSLGTPNRERRIGLVPVRAAYRAVAARSLTTCNRQGQGPGPASALYAFGRNSRLPCRPCGRTWLLQGETWLQDARQGSLLLCNNRPSVT